MFGSMQHRPHFSNNRFAWLTPLQENKASQGPWILTENKAHLYANTLDDSSRKITVDGILILIANALDFDSIRDCGIAGCEWQSDCGKYKIMWNKQKSDSTRLFVQKREDHYSRIELHIDGELVLAFQEPVWPHLQHNSPSKTSRLDIPTGCLRSLQVGNGSISETNGAKESAASHAKKHQAA